RRGGLDARGSVFDRDYLLWLNLKLPASKLVHSRIRFGRGNVVSGNHDPKAIRYSQTAQGRAGAGAAARSGHRHADVIRLKSADEFDDTGEGIHLWADAVKEFVLLFPIGGKFRLR